MGRKHCPRHGRTQIDFVSAAVATAVAAGSPLSVSRVAWEVPGRFPPSRAWVDDATLGRVAGRILSLDELEGFVPICDRCLEEWLVSIGADLTRSEEEHRHLDLHRALDARLRPVLAPALQRCSRSWSFESRRGAPFVASAQSVIIVVSDEGHTLRGTASTTLALASTLPPPIEVPLEAATLDEAALRVLTQWAAQVANALK